MIPYSLCPHRLEGGRGRPTHSRRVTLTLVAVVVSLVLSSAELAGQSVFVRDLTINEGDIPVRLLGYGIVTGLNGTGDRVTGSRDGSMTVRTVANLLRNMGIEVPERLIRTRNAAAVLVTAEVSRYTRTGGRFDVSVSSLGDATSLRGGVLWLAPLSATVGGQAYASAQGNIQLQRSPDERRRDVVETSAVLQDGGVALADFGGTITPPERLLLRDPNLGTAQLIADAINASVGAGTATVEDPGSVAIQLPADNAFGTLVAMGDLPVTPSTASRVVVDARSGVVAAGGNIAVGPAVVSHDWLTVSIADADAAPPVAPAPGDPAIDAVLPPGAVRAETGVEVQALAEALHAVGATADIIGAVLRSLRDVGALHAEVQVR